LWNPSLANSPQATAPLARRGSTVDAPAADRGSRLESDFPPPRPPRLVATSCAASRHPVHPAIAWSATCPTRREEEQTLAWLEWTFLCPQVLGTGLCNARRTSMLAAWRGGAIVASMAERFYVNSLLGPGPVEIHGAEAHHLAKVCRLRPKDQVCLFNGDG